MAKTKRKDYIPAKVIDAQTGEHIAFTDMTRSEWVEWEGKTIQLAELGFDDLEGFDPTKPVKVLKG